MIANTVSNETVSTNDDARTLAEAGCPHGTWVSTRKQIAGRGRLGRKWESVEGNLFLSIVVRPETEKKLIRRPDLSWVPLMTALAIAETLRGYLPALALAGLEIKWPNDLWLDKKKVGGILCEAAGTASQSFIIIGIGINCAFAPEGLDQPTTSLSAVVPKVTADEIRMPVLGAVLAAFSELSEHGPSRIRERYETLSVFQPGTEICWGAREEEKQGIVEKLGSSGELCVRDLLGESLRLFAEDVKIRAVRPKVF